MASCCQRFSIIASNKYWNELPSSKPSFFKVMAGDFHHLMKIPDEFTTCFKGELAGWWVLRGPSGQEWRVMITRTAKIAYFSKGWDNFVTDHGLKPLDFCVFSNSEASTFDVLIFKMSGSEHEGAYFATKSSLFSSSGMCTSSLHPQGSNAQVMNVEESGDESDENGMLEKEQDDYEYDHAQGSQVQDSGKRKIHETAADLSYSSSDEDMDDEENQDEDGEEKEEEDEDEDEDIPSRAEGAKQRQTIHISRRRAVTEAEIQRTYDLASSHVCRNGNKGSRNSVIVKMKRSHVYQSFIMTIPKSWALQHMCHRNHDVRLRVPGVGGSWTVGCRWTPRLAQCQLKARWPKFVLDNNLEEEDVCVFELLQKGDPSKKKNAVFNVHIFRVVNEKVPLRKGRVFVN